MIPALVRLNGKMFTRNSVAVRVNGIFRITSVDNIGWNDEVATELVPGMNDGGIPLGKATGPYACGASIAIHWDYCPVFELAVLSGSPQALNNLNAATFQL